MIPANAASAALARDDDIDLGLGGGALENGLLMEEFGNVNFYLMTVVAAVPGILLFWLLMRSGLVDASVGTAGKVETDEPNPATPR